jgi:cell wall-associated NlpC family hydrolase
MTTAPPDRRLTFATERVAHSALRGHLARATFVDATPARIGASLVDLCASPKGPRDRQLVYGDAVEVLETREGAAFVRAGRDGYCGWVSAASLGEPLTPTHVVRAAATHAYADPKVQAGVNRCLYFGASLVVRHIAGAWADTDAGFVPVPHLRPAHAPETDPVAVAERFLHAPYLWGGNSVAGIDCSGLLQAAHLACAIPCPGDSDLQLSGLGRPVAMTAPPRRGEAWFWRGHVGLLVAPDRMIHANAHAMAVAIEPLAAAIDRIAQAGGGPVIGRRSAVN